MVSFIALDRQQWLEGLNWAEGSQHFLQDRMYAQLSETSLRT